MVNCSSATQFLVKKIFGSIILLTSGLTGTAFAAYGAEAADSVGRRELDEVVVTGQSARQRVGDVTLGAERLELSRLAQVPVLFGENDIVKSITLMPGVHSESQAGGFEVRGGNATQNLVTLDGITLYNPSHVMGIFSTFNDNAIGRATLYKGPIPAFYGGATSSVLETALAPGDMETYHGSMTVGILAAKIKAEGPVIRDRLSFAVTARRSYVDLFLKMIPQYRSTVMNFYDITAKVRYIPRGGDVLDVSFFLGHDNLAVGDIMGMYWGNLGVSVNWLAHSGENLRFATTFAMSRYTPHMVMSMMQTDQRLRESIGDYSLNERVTWAVSDEHALEFGLRSELFRVMSAEFVYNGTKQRDVRSGWQNALWAAWDGVFAERWAVSAGVRAGAFSALGGSRFNEFMSAEEQAPAFRSKTYLSLEPRVSLKYDISGTHAIKAGAGVTTQQIHSIRSSATTFPFDRYALSSAGVKPEESVLYALSYAGMTADGAFDWSAETYYKDIRNVYDYRDGRTMFSELNLENIILGGRGRSYGLELMARKNTGRLTGWVSYTLSQTQTRIPGINGGRWYDASNDRRHDFSATAIYRLTPRWTLSGSWVFSSGQPLTAPDVKYELSGTTCYYYSRRNGYRTPSPHRLDLSATYTHEGPKFTYQWTIGVYNAYCRYNPFVVYFEDDDTKPSGTRAVQQSLFGLIPSVSYTLKF